MSAKKKKQQSDKWREEVAKTLNEKPFESLYTTTYEGMTLKPLYTEEDPKYIGGREQQDKAWKCSQEIRGEMSDEIKEKIKSAKKRGQDSYYVNQFQWVNSIKDIELAFEPIDFTESTLLIDVGVNVGFIPLVAHYIHEHKLYDSDIGTIGFDPYEGLLFNQKDSLSLSENLDLLAETMKWCEANHCKMKCLLIKGNMYHEAGAHALQELIYSFSELLDVINELTNRGISIEMIAKRTMLSFAIGSHFFMEIAKFRAARRLWASLFQSFIGGTEGVRPYLHGITSKFNKTAYDLEMNILRSTTEGFSAAVAGIDELTISAFDNLNSNQTKLSERIARNTHFILQEENGLGTVIDPGKGSYLIETLTNELAEHAWSEMKKIDASGGFLKELEKGIPQKELEKMYAKRREDLNKKRTTMIGINEFVNLSSSNCTYITNNPKQEKSSGSQGNQIVTTFEQAYQFVKEKKLLPVFQAQKRHKLEKTIKHVRLAEHLEKLRYQALAYKKEKGQSPFITVLVLGRLKDYKPRLDYITTLLSVGGIEVKTITQDQELTADGPLIVCGKDSDYQHISDSLLTIIKNRSVRDLFIVGQKLDERMGQWRNCTLISNEIDRYEFLMGIHRLLGGTNNETL